MKSSHKRVQSTNDSSILSKYSMVKAGYFGDEFLRYFVNKDARRSPLINRGYYIRMKAVDSILRAFLTSEFYNKKQIISLGAGFDTSFFRFNAEGLLNGSCKFYEVDYPKVVQNKKSMIHSEPTLCTAIGKEHDITGLGMEGIHTDKYTLIGCNLKDFASLQRIMLSCDMDVCCPTLLLSEVVLCYLDAKSSSTVINWAATLFSSAVFVAYEQVFPDDPFGLVMTKHFLQVGSPLRSIGDFRTPEEQISRYKKQGWPLVQYQNMISFQNSLPNEELLRIRELEAFDEFEEWDLKCAHYITLAAFKGDCEKMSQQLFIDKQNRTSHTNEQKGVLVPHLSRVENPSRLQRYGHSCTLLPSGDLIVIGGFGELSTKHMRLPGILVMRKVRDKWQCEDVSCTTGDTIGSRMFHSATLIKSGSILLFGGRSSPYKPFSTIFILNIHSTKTTSDKQQTFEQSTLPVGPSNRKCSEPINQPGADSTSDITGSYDETMCSLTSLSSKGPGPTPRWRHTATSINNGERVVVFGGRTSTVLALNDCYILHILDNKWEKVDLQDELPTPRHSHTASLWRTGDIVLAGGLDANGVSLSLLQTIDTKNMTLKTLNVTPPLNPLYSHTAHVIQDNLILIGGINQHSTGIPSIIVVNLTFLTWSLFSLPVCPGISPLMLHNHTSAVLDSHSIMVFGGGGNCFSFGTHLNSEPLEVDIASLGLSVRC